jgi:hypothetical protein
VLATDDERRGEVGGPQTREEWRSIYAQSNALRTASVLHAMEGSPPAMGSVKWYVDNMGAINNLFLGYAWQCSE